MNRLRRKDNNVYSEKYLGYSHLKDVKYIFRM